MKGTRFRYSRVGDPFLGELSSVFEISIFPYKGLKVQGAKPVKRVFNSREKVESFGTPEEGFVDEFSRFIVIL